MASAPPAPPDMEPPSISLEGPDLSLWDVLKAMGTFHDSLAEQLKCLAKEVSQLNERAVSASGLAPGLRRPSVSSDQSHSSILRAPPKTSRSQKSQSSMGVHASSSPTQSLALQALQMDMSQSLLPFQHKKGGNGSPALSLPIPMDAPKRGKKKRAIPEVAADASPLNLPGAMIGVLPRINSERSRGSLGSPGPMPATAGRSNAQNSMLSDGGPGSGSITNPARSDGQTYMHTNSERSWARLGPVGGGESEELCNQPSENSIVPVSNHSNSDRPALTSNPPGSNSDHPGSVTSIPPSGSPDHGSFHSPPGVGSPTPLKEPRSFSHTSLLQPEAARPPNLSEVAGDFRPAISFRENGAENPVGSAVSHKASLPSSGSRRRSQSSLQLSRAISTGNLTEVFKVKENELTKDLASQAARAASKRAPVEDVIREVRSPAEELPSDAESGSEEDEKSEEEEEEESFTLSRSHRCWMKLSFLSDFLVLHASRALGLVPLFRLEEVEDAKRRPWRRTAGQAMSRVYHWSVISFLLFGVIMVAWDLNSCHLKAKEMDLLCSGLKGSPPLAVDLVLFLAATVVLWSWGGVFKYQEMTQLIAASSEELSTYCDQNSLDRAWKIWSSSDAFWSLLLWVLLVCERLSLLTWLLGSQDDSGVSSIAELPSWLFWRLVLETIMFTISSAVLVTASFWQIRTSHAMLLIVNAWSASFLGGHMNCSVAKHEWRRVSGLFRKTSRTFERCFAALACTIVVLVLAALYDLRQGRDVEVLPSVAVAFFLPGVLWTCLDHHGLQSPALLGDPLRSRHRRGGPGVHQLGHVFILERVWLLCLGYLRQSKSCPEVPLLHSCHGRKHWISDGGLQLCRDFRHLKRKYALSARTVSSDSSNSVFRVQLLSDSHWSGGTRGQKFDGFRGKSRCKKEIGKEAWHIQSLQGR